MTHNAKPRAGLWRGQSNGHGWLAAAFRAAKSRGNTLAFVLIFLAILSCLAIPISRVFLFSREATVKSKYALIGLNLATQTMEEIKAMRFSEVNSMLPTQWDSFEGEWISEEGEKINYPELYKIFKKQVLVRSGKDLPSKNPNIKEVRVNIKWDEVGETRNIIEHKAIKLITYIAKENPGD